MKNNSKTLLVTIITSIILVTIVSLFRQYSGTQFMTYYAIFSSYYPLQNIVMWGGLTILIPIIGIYIFQIFTLNTWIIFILPMFLLTLIYRLLLKQEMSRSNIITASLIFTIIGYIPLSFTIYPSLSATVSSISRQMNSPNAAIAPIPQLIFIFIICLLSLVFSNNLIKTLIVKNTFSTLKKKPFLLGFIIILCIVVFIAPTYKTINYLSCDPGLISYGDPIKEANINPSHLAHTIGGYINPKGEFAIKTSYADAKEFNDGLAAINIDKKWGYIDTLGNVVIKPSYKTAGQFSEGLAAVQTDNNKWGFINKSGIFIIKPTFDYAYYFSDGVALISLNNKYGYINKSGQIVISPKYFSAGVFNNGLAPATDDGSKWMFINKSGKVTLNPRLNESVMAFENGLATTLDKKHWVKIDTTGKEICGGSRPYHQ